MKKRKFTAKFKTQVVLEGLKEQSNLSELAQKYKLAPSQISSWKQQFLSGAEDVFSKGKSIKSSEEEEKDALLRTIGELKVENDFLKKVLK